MLKTKKYLFVLFLIATTLLSADLSYKVEFSGLRNRQALKALEDSSDLVLLQNKPPPSLNALRYRVESDIPNMLKALHSYAYYDAEIISDITIKKEKATVHLFIDPGVQYILKSYNVLSSECEPEPPFSLEEKLPLEKLGIEVGKPAIAKPILEADMKLLEKLAKRSYPLSSIENRKVIVDVKDKTVSVDVCVKVGAFARFGLITVSGLEDIDPTFIERKIEWKEGEPFNLEKIQITEKRLMATNLFSSVLVSYDDKLDESGELPIRIRLTESNHQSFNVGVSYATLDGPGVSGGWEHRNMAQRGQLLSLDLDISKIASSGIATYKIPDFYRLNQDYIWQGLVFREDVVPYTAYTYRLENRMRWNLSKSNRVSFGVKGEFIDVDKSITDGTFTFLGLPFFAKYFTPKSLLNPTSGVLITYKATPYQSITHKSTFFFKQRFTTAFYIPVVKSRKIVIAARLQFASIVGASLFSIPFTKRLLGGSDNDLRGYRFKTVSPTDATGNPTGGRSAIYWTVELRLRPIEPLGIVPFTDFGTVSTKTYPDVNEKWFKSIGIGLRYFTFFGPLRLDVGVPLDKRPRDPNYRIYVSIGQTF